MCSRKSGESANRASAGARIELPEPWKGQFMNPNSPARVVFRSVLAGLLLSGIASAAEVRVMISAGFHGVYSELAPAFERASGHRLVTTRGPSMGDSPEALPTRLARGETADVVIMDGGA